MCQGSARARGSVGAPGMSRPGARRPGLFHSHSRASGTILGTGTGQGPVALLSVALRQGRAIGGWRAAPYSITGAGTEGPGGLKGAMGRWGSPGGGQGH